MGGVVVETQYGAVRGEAADGVVRFFGIPYAAAPVGPNRFRAPQPHPEWEGVREATKLGPNAPHGIKPFPGLEVEPLIGTGWRPGDDYLNLNIWAPERPPGDASPEESRAARVLLPVMVFIHGGGFVVGSNYAAVQDGSAFARSGVVMIAINYRMGIDGFLPIPGVPTNLGLRDMLFALRWVKENAASFGGDPDNVTVFGESAGAMAIADLIASPLARGLFRRAIVQSGHGAMVRSIPVAQRLVRKLAKVLGVSPDAEGFRRTTFGACIKAVEKVSLPTARIDLRDEEGREPVFGISRFIPVYGDDVLPTEPLDALDEGMGAEIDLLIGTNREEMNLYLGPTGVRRRIWGWLARYVLGRSQPNAGKVLKEYGFGQPGVRPGDALAEATHDLVFRWPARRFAAAHQGRTHFYEFDWQTKACEGTLGACHALELPFVFNTLAPCCGPKGLVGEDPPQALADHVHGLWVGFARDGSLPWPEFNAETRQIYRLDKQAAEYDPIVPAARYLP